MSIKNATDDPPPVLRRSILFFFDNGIPKLKRSDKTLKDALRDRHNAETRTIIVHRSVDSTIIVIHMLS